MFRRTPIQFWSNFKITADSNFKFSFCFARPNINRNHRNARIVHRKTKSNRTQPNRNEPTKSKKPRWTMMMTIKDNARRQWWLHLAPLPSPSSTAQRRTSSDVRRSMTTRTTTMATGQIRDAANIRNAKLRKDEKRLGWRWWTRKAMATTKTDKVRKIDSSIIF